MNNRKKLINRLKADVSVLEEYLIKRPYSIEEKCFEEILIRDITLAIIELEKVLAWQPLPEPCEEEEESKSMKAQ